MPRRIFERDRNTELWFIVVDLPEMRKHTEDERTVTGMLKNDHAISFKWRDCRETDAGQLTHGSKHSWKVGRRDSRDARATSSQDDEPKTLRVSFHFHYISTNENVKNKNTKTKKD